MIIDNYKEPERIISYNEGRIITKKEYELLKRKAKSVREKIIKDSITLNDNSYITNVYIENIINATEYSDLNTTQKEIMLANAILPDDIKIIDILTENGFTIEHLKTIMRFRAILKNQVMYNNLVITEKLTEQINIYKKVINKLISIFRENFHVNNSTIILNRICELLVTSQDLFNSKSFTKKRTK